MTCDCWLKHSETGLTPSSGLDLVSKHIQGLPGVPSSSAHSAIYGYVVEACALINPVKVAATSVKLAIPLEKCKPRRSIKEIAKKTPILHQ